MKRILPYLFLITFFLSINAQQSKIDSLKNLLARNSDKELGADINFKISQEFYNLRIPDSIINYALKTLKETDNDTLKFKANRMLSNIYFVKKDFSTSMKYLENCKTIFSKINIPEFQEDIYWRAARLQLRTRSYQKAEENLLRLKEVLKKTDTVGKRIAGVNRELGVLYKHKNEFKKSRLYSFEALEYYKKSGLERMTYATHELIASSYMYEGLYEKAFFHTKKSLDIKNTIKAKKSGISYSQLGRLYFLKNNKDYDSSYVNLKRAKNIYTQRKDLEDLMNIELHFLNLYIRKNEKDSSLTSLSRYLGLRDSLEQGTNRKFLSKFESELGLVRKEKENLQLKAENAEQALLTQKANTRNWLLGFGLLTLLISVFFIYKRYKSEAKAKEIISKQKTQIEKLQKEFHHRIKNDFRSINSFIRLAQKKFPDTEFQERLNELKNRVTSMFKVHELLLEQDDVTQVKARPYLVELSENVKQKYQSENITIDYKIDDKEVIIADKSVPFGIIVNEFVTNSYKHAFNGSGNILVNFYSDKSNHYLTLKDNGRGLPLDFDAENLRSFGMEIMPLLAEQYDGKFTLENNKGVSINVILPKKVA